MTDTEFDTYFKGLSIEDLFRYLGENLHLVEFKGRAGYVIESVEDLKAAIEQRIYEEMTGRE